MNERRSSTLPDAGAQQTQFDENGDEILDFPNPNTRFLLCIVWPGYVVARAAGVRVAPDVIATLLTRTCDPVEQVVESDNARRRGSVAAVVFFVTVKQEFQTAKSIDFRECS
jgi:hypothetical protein